MRISWLKVGVFTASLIPLARLVANAFGMAGTLGANPVEEILHRFGFWGLTFLMLTLAVTPARKLPGLNKLIKIRRMLGLFAFFYVVMHFLTYAWLDQHWSLAAIVEDIVKRPYITIGMLALALLVPLAATSTNAMVRRLGPRWQKLHRLIYVIAILGVWHFYWQVKKDLTEPLIFGAILAFLLGYRLFVRRQKAKRRAARA